MRFAALMVLPTMGATAVEWVVLTHFFAADLGRPHEREAAPAWPHLPRFALAVLGATLMGFLLSSLLGIAPLWIAAAGAAVITIPAIWRKTVTPRAVVSTVEPAFLIFVLGLGVIVATASDNGLATAVGTVLPDGASLLDLLCIAAVSAVVANLVNNLPAILILAPALAPAGHGSVLAALVGVNVGPNLTYVGSLATLLWRKILRAEDTEVKLGEFLRLGVATVPAALVVATLLLWSIMEAGIYRCACSSGLWRRPGSPLSRGRPRSCPPTRTSPCCLCPRAKPRRSPAAPATDCSAGHITPLPRRLA
jgi:arsenical pump membrane protein